MLAYGQCGRSATGFQQRLDPGQPMWITIAFISTAALFVGLTMATLYHQRWARRLPALEALPAPADGLPTQRGALLGDRGGAR